MAIRSRSVDNLYKRPDVDLKYVAEALLDLELEYQVPKTVTDSIAESLLFHEERMKDKMKKVKA